MKLVSVILIVCLVAITVSSVASAAVKDQDGGMYQNRQVSVHQNDIWTMFIFLILDRI